MDSIKTNPCWDSLPEYLKQKVLDTVFYLDCGEEPDLEYSAEWTCGKLLLTGTMDEAARQRQYRLAMDGKKLVFFGSVT